LTFNLSYAQVELLKTTQLNSFPSASTLSYYNKYLYVLGDDASDLLILNNDHKEAKAIKVFTAKGKRIDKDEKADFEASSLFTKGNRNYLIGFSSFSQNNRNKILVCNLSKPVAPSLKFISTKDPLKDLNVEETNIEGAAFIANKLLLSNRANNTYKTNYLVIAGFDAKRGIKTKDANVIKIKLPDTDGVIGISGLEYVKEKDILLFVASTENTSNAIEDGEIGDSYLGYINNISKKLDQQEVTVDNFSSFTKAVKGNKVYKIESIAVESVNGNELLLHLAADNDDGKSTLFKIKWTM
jgi:hypothetical protein